VFAALVGALGLAGCGPGATPTARHTPACEFHLPAAPRPDRAPTAVLRDVAAGPTEYLLGSPGGSVTRLTVATGFSPPQLTGNTLFFSVRHGTAGTTLFRGVLGGCAHRIAEATMGAVEPRGRALSALVNNHWVLLDGEGRQVTTISGSAGSWTSDGHLVEPAVSGVDISDLAVRKMAIKISGVAPLSALGSHQVLVSTVNGIQVMDIATGNLSAMLPATQPLRGASGSPDGNLVAYLDQNGVGQVLDTRTHTTAPLPAPALTTGFVWSRDSTWIGVQATYGGAAMRLTDNLVVMSGSQLVVSW
jgi:hypothetical protein